MAPASPQPLHVDAVLGLEPVLMRVCGDLDMDSAPSLRTELEPLLDKSVELDLADVTFIDSSGVNVLLSHHERCRAAGGSLVVLHPSRAVQQILQLLGVDGLLAQQHRTEGRHDPGDGSPGMP
ncbi:STAS domain-containing protein [Streptomyces sp. BA2]|uniref:STAS domain-containing protein n=1 Tax=Streptomyces sp. BA2 TaxID=436595 RepID=UPI00132A9968|nr:STAS domain-containing protein [Streptomyces sp. BA2]MWA15797.1 anti-sigma factor antagonist [Streptomyces sp. BA2]